jgi:PAS domain S-box-containing protein
MKFKTKISISFVVIIGLVVFFGGFLLYQIENIKGPLTNGIPQSINEIKKTSKLDSLSQFIRYYDEVLTQSARNYAFTGDKKWEDRYKTVEPQLDTIIKEAISEGDAKDKECFASVDSANQALVKLEYKALSLTDSGNNKDAISILESKEYWDLKNVYQKGIMDYVSMRGSAYNDALVAHTQTLENIVNDIQNLFTSATQLIAFAIILGIPSAVIIYQFILRKMMLQITKLTIATKEISSGNLDTSVDIGGDDEIRDLSTSFNSMTKSLKQSKDLLFESEFKYKNLYDFSPFLRRTIDKNGIITDCNNTYAESLNMSKNEIVGKSIYDFVSAQHTDSLKESFAEWTKNGIIKDKEIWLRKKDGTEFPVLLSANNLYDKTGQLTGSNTVMRDISDIYFAKKEIEDLKMRRLTVIGELSARVAHDMRNPLSILKNSLELIKIRMPEPDKMISNDLAMAQRAVSRMSHQIEEVLEYVTPKPLNLKKTTLSEILTSALEGIRPPKSVTINLPLQDMNILCDPLKMEIVFVNLINNALQEIKDSGRIDIRTHLENDFIIIEVEDSGSGIPDNLLTKIFDPLFTTRQIGTGLGLPSVKSIIEKHEGTIYATNGINKGALFVIKLPMLRS